MLQNVVTFDFPTIIKVKTNSSLSVMTEIGRSCRFCEEWLFLSYMSADGNLAELQHFLPFN